MFKIYDKHFKRCTFKNTTYEIKTRFASGKNQVIIIYTTRHFNQTKSPKILYDGVP